MFHKLRIFLRSIPGVYRVFTRVRNKCLLWWYGVRKATATTCLHLGSRIAQDLIIGEYSSIGPGCWISPNVVIGRYVLFAPNVVVVGADHRFDLPGVPMMFSGRPTLKQTVIEDDVWVGYGVIIIAGIRIGRGAIVAAGAVVTKDVPPYEIWGGIPARKISERFANPRAREIHEQMLAEPAKEGRYCEPRY